MTLVIISVVWTTVAGLFLAGLAVCAHKQVSQGAKSDDDTPWLFQRPCHQHVIATVLALRPVLIRH
jgi:hypothetical protein